MGKTAVLVVVVAASLAFAPLDGTRVRSCFPVGASTSVKVDLISRTVWQPIQVSLGDIINEIIKDLGQLIEKFK